MPQNSTEPIAATLRPYPEQTSWQTRLLNFVSSLGSRSIWLALILLGSGLTITTLSSLYIRAEVEKSALQEFNLICNEIQLNIADRLNDNSKILYSGAALFNATDTVSRTQWQTFITELRLETTLPGTQGVGFALLIPSATLEQHIQAIRSEGFPDYTVRPAGARDLYTSIIYLEPFSGRNLRAFGYDMFSEPVRRAAMEQARDQDKAILSGKVILVQETDQEVQSGTLMYVPIYQNGLPTVTVEERRAAIRGWVYSPYRMTDLMRGTLREWGVKEQNRQITLQIYDGNTISAESLLYDSRDGSHISNPIPKSTANNLIPVDFEGHRWTLHFTQTGNLLSAADNSKIWLFFLGGTCISLLVFGLTLSLLRTRITARRIAQKLTFDVREREENLSITLHSIGDGVIATDLDGNVVRLNPIASKLCGYTFREADGKPFSEIFNIFNADTRKPAANPVKHVLDTGQIFKLDNHTILISKDGIEYQIADSAAPIKDKDGLISGVVIVFSDVTEKNETEAELRKTSEQLKSIMEGTRDEIAMLDTNHRYILFNPAFHEEFKHIFGVDIKPGDSMPQALAHLASDQANATQYWTRALAGEDFTVSQQFGDTNLKRNWYELHFSPIRNKEGKIISAVHIAHNISERLQAQHDLQAARDELEMRVLERTSDLQAANLVIQKASKAKDDFIAVMSHELRTPLTGILGLSQVMQFPTYGDLTPKQLSTVQNIEKSGQHLLELINQILDFSKIQAGKLEMQPLPCSLNKICQAALQMVNSLANKKNQELTFNISPENIFLNADERRLRQVLLNLLSNAIKFTPDAGHIDLNVIGLPKTHQVMISVRDSGIGIKPEDLSKLFEPFVQLDMRLSREYEGTGLGLALVKQMVELHGGSVKVESSLGTGSLFTIHLPWLGTTI